MNEPTGMTVEADEAMVQAFLDAHDGDVAKATVDWQKVKAEADAQRERDLEAARNWKPKVEVTLLTPWERSELDRLLADRLAKKPTVGAIKRWRDDAPKGPAYALAALEGEAQLVSSSPVGGRNDQLNRSAWTLGRLVHDGLIDAADVEQALVDAAQDAGLTAQEAKATVRGALRRRRQS
jgi:hypothetical protein